MEIVHKMPGLVLDDTAAISMAQAKANMDNQPISIYIRKSGEFIIGRDITLIKMMLGANEQIAYHKTIQPNNEG